MSSNEPRTRARERYEKRRQRRSAMAQRKGGTRQIVRADAPQLPDLSWPGGRWLLLVPFGLFIIFGVILVLREINPPDPTTLPNGIWLTTDWTYADNSDDDYINLLTTLRRHQIGEVYAYVSSLRADGTWAGPDAQNRFSTVEANVRRFAERFDQVYPDAQLYAWIEVRANPPGGYRLDDRQLQRTVAEFSQNAIERYGFDGVLLDVKPLFDGNEDYLALLRTVRASIGLDRPMVVAVPPDFTPTEADIVVPGVIEPGTVWSAEYKQRVGLQADQLVVTAYNSYLTNPLDYINWVSYQVEAFTSALSQMDTGSTLLISIPHYDSTPQVRPDIPPAHDEDIESIAGALDGVVRAAGRLDEETERPLLQGVAIFAVRPLTDDDWAVYREKWLR